MSPTVAGSLVQDLVEMAKATERLPIIEAECSALRSQNDGLASTIMDREASIQRYKAEIEALNSRIREAEQGRDAAETMFLECDDKLSAFRRLVEAFGTDTRSLIRAQEPVVAEAVKEWSGSPDPVSPDTHWINDTTSERVAAEGQREPDPTVALSMEAPSAPTAQQPTMENAMELNQQTASATVSASPSGPYTGKLYMRLPGFISRTDWLEGGGSNEAYNWRQGQIIPEGIIGNGRPTADGT